MNLVGFIILCLIWGTTWLGIKMSLEGLPPFLGAASRFALSSLILWMIIKIRGVSLKLSRRDAKAIILSAFFMYVFDYGLIYWGEQHISAGVTAIFFATFTLFTAIWSNFLYKTEAFCLTKTVGLLLGFVGIVIVFYDQLLLTQFNTRVILGAGAIVLGAAGGSLAVVMVKHSLGHLNAFSLTFYQGLAGVFFLFLLSLFFDDFTRVAFTPRVLGAVAYLSLIGSAFAFTLYYKMLKTLSPITMALIIYITPIVALGGDYLLFGETISWRALAGTGVIFAGIALTQRSRKRA